MLNHVDLVGRLVRDPELKITATGAAVVVFMIAVDRDHLKSESDVRQTDFINCIAWNKTAEYLCKYGFKGRVVVVSGRLQIREWTDATDSKLRNVEVLIDNLYFTDRQKRAEVAGNDATLNNTDTLPF